MTCTLPFGLVPLRSGRLHRGREVYLLWGPLRHLGSCGHQQGMRAMGLRVIPRLIEEPPPPHLLNCAVFLSQHHQAYYELRKQMQSFISFLVIPWLASGHPAPVLGLNLSVATAGPEEFRKL